MKIRVVKTASKAQAVQVVRYQDNKRIVLQHIGSAHSEEELSNLMILAEDWIKDNTSQLSIFPDKNPGKMLHINFIVGARLGNISAALLKTIDNTIVREDGKSIRIKTDNGYLICGYSSVRYRKDKYEMEKQIEKAKQVIAKPSKSKKMKFTRTKGQKIELNETLIRKTQKLLGIKGYYTNLEASAANNTMIIERYHELFKVEQAFRISKNDLQTRPIFHFKEQPIKLHIMICFMALVVSKHIELKTGVSIRKFIDESQKIVDGEILNHITQKIVTVKAQPTPKMMELTTKLEAPH